MKNIPEVKLGIIAVSRDCFPIGLSISRREAIVKAYGEGIYECPVTVENELDALKALEDVKAAGVNALVVFLGNFGPETPETLLCQKFDGPVMYVAAAEGDGDLINGRGDAYCGMLNCSYNLGMRHLKAYIPEYPVGTAQECADMIREFVPIARAIIGVKNLKIITFGPRPQDFFACNAPIKGLYELGVEIEENIDTKMVSSEMLTAVISACAQAESESISKNMRWSYQKRMSNGTYTPSSVAYGYRLIDKQIMIQPDEAVVVSQIFTLYLSGYSKWKIADFLNSQGIRTRKGNKWDYCAIRYILRNERYAGNSLWQKTYKTEDFPPKKLRNHGECAKYFAENTHPAIIEEDEFCAVQRLLEERRDFFAERACTEDPVQKRLVCGNCGSRFRKKTSEGIAYWTCRKHSNQADACPTMPIPVEEVEKAFLRMWFQLKQHGSDIFTYLIKSIQTIHNRQMLWSPAVVELNKQISDILSQSHDLTLLNKQGLVDPDIFISKSNQLAEQLRKAKQQKETLLKREDNDFIEQTKCLREVIQAGPEYLDVFEEELFCELVDKIIVESNTKIRFRLKNGLELPEFLERTVR